MELASAEPPRLPAADSRAFFRFYADYKRRRGEAVFCLQVGANDGRTDDPVHQYLSAGWSGLLLEPLPDVFENELKVSYAGNSNVILENAALAHTEGVIPLHTVSVSRARWATGLATFQRECLYKHIENGYIARKAREEGIELPPTDEIIRTVDVRATTLPKLLAKHSVTRFDVLCIDTEGFDYEILKMVDFDAFRPDVVFFESKNLSRSDYTLAVQELQLSGYELYIAVGDTVATRIHYPTASRLRARELRRLRAVAGRLRRAGFGRSSAPAAAPGE